MDKIVPYGGFSKVEKSGGSSVKANFTVFGFRDECTE